MITKITENNSPNYIKFLGKAYQYLEYLERLNAYQALCKMEYIEAYKYLSGIEVEGSDSGLINSTFIDDSKALEEIKKSKSLVNEVYFDTYCKKYLKSVDTSEQKNFTDKVYIIAEGHRVDITTDEERIFQNYNQYKQYQEKYALYKELVGEDALKLQPIEIIDPLDRSEDGTFVTLEQYFNYIETIKRSGRGDHFLLSLPLDEGLIDINVNTRNITIPKDFISTVVQNDALAETMVFTVDRFIENIDLANADEIYVQWSAPNGEGGIREEATIVRLIDREDSKKIKFGWPISKEVTLHPGKVSFSAVFVIKNPNNPAEVNFRLNTLPETFEVKPALQPNITTDVTDVGTAFYYAIRNNRYPGQGMTAPQPPTFRAPGLDLQNNDPVEKLKLEKEEDVLKFEAQAIVTDIGRLTYNWFVRPEGATLSFNCAGGKHSFEPTDIINEIDYNWFGEEERDTYFEKDEENSTDKENFYKLKGDVSQSVTYPSFGKISIAYKKVPSEQIIPEDTYFVNNGKDEGQEEFLIQEKDDTFIRYTGEPNQKDLSKYEKFTVFQMPYDADENKLPEIVGEYFVVATASAPGRHSETKKMVSYDSNPTHSIHCFVNGPIELEFAKDGNLNEAEFLWTPGKVTAGTMLTDSEITTLKNRLETRAQKDNIDNAFTKEVTENGVTKKRCETPVAVQYKEIELGTELEQTSGEVKYYWHHSLDRDYLEKSENDDKTKIESDEKNPKRVLTEPGFYKQKIIAKKNRKYNDLTSRIVKITYAPRAVSLTLAEDCQTDANRFENYQDSEIYIFDTISSKDRIKLSVVPHLWVNKIGDTITNNEYLALSENDRKNYINYLENADEKQFYTEDMEYRWYRREVKSEENKEYVDTPLLSSDKYLISPSTEFDLYKEPTITIAPRPKDLGADPDEELSGDALRKEAYVCKVTNIIGKRRSEIAEIMMFIK